MIALRVAALLTLLVTGAAAQAQQPARRSEPQAQPQPQASRPLVPRPRNPDKVFPVGASWVGVSLNGKPFGGDRPSLTINQQFRATGFGGCNNYAATAFPLREQTLVVSPFALTKKSCGKDVMAREQAFLVALRTASKWDLQGSTLIVQTQSGELRFERAL